MAATIQPGKSKLVLRYMDGIRPNGKPRLLKRSLPGPLPGVSNQELYDAAVALFRLLECPLTGVFLYCDSDRDDL